MAVDRVQEKHLFIQQKSMLVSYLLREAAVAQLYERGVSCCVNAKKVEHANVLGTPTLGAT